MESRFCSRLRPSTRSAASLMLMSSTFWKTGSGVPLSSVARSIRTWLWLVGQTMRLRPSTKE